MSFITPAVGLGIAGTTALGLLLSRLASTGFLLPPPLGPTPALQSRTGTPPAKTAKPIPVITPPGRGLRASAGTIAASGATVATTALLTQTPGGQKTVQQVTGLGEGVTKFISQNPGIVVGGLIITGAVLLRRR